MKKILMLCAFVMAAGLVSGQAKTCTKAEKAACAKTCTKAQKAACAKTCTKGKKASAEAATASTSVLASQSVADILAAEDESIERRECAKSGKVGYFKTTTCAKSGKETTAEVKYCEKSEAFVNASPSSKVLSALSAADVLAAEDENIERKECALSGNVSYYKKSVCAASGKVSMDEVKYCEKSEAFVNASPVEVMNDQKAKVIKTAETVDGAVQKAKSTKKACCKGKKKCSSKKAGA